jgi:hypothetical protein
MSVLSELWWEIDGKTVLLPRSQWPFEPRRLGTITSIAKENPMTEDELKAIEARAQAATKGPWEHAALIDEGQPDREVIVAGASGALFVVVQQPNTLQQCYDAGFASSARSDVPALVAEVWRLRRHSEALKRLRLVVAPSEVSPAAIDEVMERIVDYILDADANTMTT